MKYLIIIFALLFIIGCKKEEKVAAETQKADTIFISNQEKPIDSIAAPKDKSQALKELNDEILRHLKSGKYEKLAEKIHPEKGIRFSMYAYVNPEKDKHFTKSDFEKYHPTNIKFTWGLRDGTGEPLVLPIKDYLKTWVFQRDFSKGKFTLNEFQGTGNSLNNLKEKYPSADFTENYLKPTGKYGDFDWFTLRFVFEKFGEEYYLVAIINDQWTI